MKLKRNIDRWNELFARAGILPVLSKKEQQEENSYWQDLIALYLGA